MVRQEEVEVLVILSFTCIRTFTNKRVVGTRKANCKRWSRG